MTRKAFRAGGAAHGGLERVNVGPAGLVLLLHLDRIPGFFQRQFARAGLARRHADGIDAAILHNPDAFVRA